MGTSESKPIGNMIPHQRFTNSQFLSKQNTIITHVSVTKQSVVQEWSQDLNNFKKQNPSSTKFLLLPLSYELEDSNFCTFTSSLKMGFQNFPYVLQEQINNRTNLSRNFEQEQMWLLFYTLLSAHNLFAKKKTKVGDIHPHNIFINQQGYPKVSCQLSWPQEVTNFQKFYYQKSIRYLAPQQLYCCKQGLSLNEADPLVAQSFSIGVTMLHAGLLKDLSPMYNNATYQLNDENLNFNIDKWMNLKFNSQKNFATSSYSALLQNMVKNLCKKVPKQRQSALSLYNILKNYEDKILNLQPIPLNLGAITNNQANQNKSSIIQFEPPKTFNNYHQQNSVSVNQNISVKFNYKSNTSPNFVQEERKIITLGKNTNVNAAILESQKGFFMKYANLHHGNSIKNPPELQKVQVKPSQIKQVFQHYADSHKNVWNSNSIWNNNSVWNGNSYPANIQNQFTETKSWKPNFLLGNNQSNTNWTTNSLNTNKYVQNKQQTNFESASDILRRIDQQILKSRSEFS